MKCFVTALCILALGVFFMPLSARAAGPVQFDLLCKYRLIAGKYRYMGTGPPADWDGNLESHYSVDLKRNLFMDIRPIKGGSVVFNIVAFSDYSITFFNSEGHMEMWDRRSKRYYSSGPTEDNTVVVEGGTCTLAKYTPFQGRVGARR